MEISEPHTSSDVTSQTTRIEKDGDEWEINGNNICSNYQSATISSPFTRRPLEAKFDTPGIDSPFLRPTTTGLTWTRSVRKWIFRASLTAELIFDNARVPKENLVGTYEKVVY